VSKTVAKEKDRAMRTNVANGTYVKSKKDPPFDMALDEQLKRSKAENQPSSYKRNLYSAKYLKEHFGSRRISAIESNEVLIRQYIKRRKAQIKEKQLRLGRTEAELSFTLINRELALMRRMFKVLIKAGKAKMNPVSLVTLFDEVEKERILTYEEEQKILKAIDQSDKRYRHLKDMLLIALNTAMRQGEILKMEKAWIDLKAGIINVPRFSQKRKRKDKRVPINSLIMPILKRLLRQNKKCGYVFVNPKTGDRYYRNQNAWDTILKKAGLGGKPWVDKLRLHDLRHTAATNLARAGKILNLSLNF
jgi:integrase